MPTSSPQQNEPPRRGKGEWPRIGEVHEHTLTFIAVLLNARTRRRYVEIMIDRYRIDSVAEWPTATQLATYIMTAADNPGGYCSPGLSTAPPPKCPLSKRSLQRYISDYQAKCAKSEVPAAPIGAAVRKS